MNDTYADIHQSLNRCLQRQDFLRRFYTLFVNSHEDIAARFRDTEWNQQIHLLRYGISASILYAGGSDLGTHELDRLHRSHGRRGYAIEAWMYDRWLEALIETLRETDSQCDPHLEQRWRSAMGLAIDRIRDGRDTRGR